MKPTSKSVGPGSPRVCCRWPMWALLAIVLAVGGGVVLLMQGRTGQIARVGSGTMVLRSPEVADGGPLPKDYTGDGTSSTLPLEWSGAPKGTKSFALIMHHVAPDQVKWYWLLYNIPADLKGLPKNVKGIGTLGNNSVNGRTEYAPPHSKGPGPKTYTYTLYALSAPPRITVEPAQVNRDVLLAATEGLILDTAELHVVYTRFPEPGGNVVREADPPPPGDGN